MPDVQSNFSKSCVCTQWGIHPSKCLWGEDLLKKMNATSIRFQLGKAHEPPHEHEHSHVMKLSSLMRIWISVKTVKHFQSKDMSPLRKSYISYCSADWQTDVKRNWLNSVSWWVLNLLTKSWYIGYCIFTSQSDVPLAQCCWPHRCLEAKFLAHQVFPWYRSPPAPMQILGSSTPWVEQVLSWWTQTSGALHCHSHWSHGFVCTKLLFLW